MVHSWQTWERDVWVAEGRVGVGLGDGNVVVMLGLGEVKKKKY